MRERLREGDQNEGIVRKSRGLRREKSLDDVVDDERSARLHAVFDENQRAKEGPPVAASVQSQRAVEQVVHLSLSLSRVLSKCSLWKKTKKKTISRENKKEKEKRVPNTWRLNLRKQNSRLSSLKSPSRSIVVRRRARAAAKNRHAERQPKIFGLASQLPPTQIDPVPREQCSHRHDSVYSDQFVAPRKT